MPLLTDFIASYGEETVPYDVGYQAQPVKHTT